MGRSYTSTDSGVTWTARDSTRVWTSVASSADGTKLLRWSMRNGGIYTSTNSGTNWTQTSAPSFGWNSVRSSKRRTKLVAAAAGGETGFIFMPRIRRHPAAWIFGSARTGDKWENAGNGHLAACASIADSADLITNDQYKDGYDSMR